MRVEFTRCIYFAITRVVSILIINFNSEILTLLLIQHAVGRLKTAFLNIKTIAM